MFEWDEGWLPVRSCDPETSRAAAIDLLPRLKERKREVLAAMETLGRPATAREIQAEMRLHGVLREIDTVRSRLSQLLNDGLVYKAGLGEGVRRDVTRWALVRR